MNVIGRLRKPDWLGELQIALVATVALLGVLAVVDVVAIAGGWPLTVEVPAGAVDGVGGATGGLTAGVAVDPHGMVDVLIDDPSARQLFAAGLISMPTFLVVMALFAMLLGVVHRVRKGGPFDKHVVWRLRLIGVVAIVGGVVARLIEFFAQLNLMSTVTDRLTTATLPLQDLFGWVLGGIALFAIAEVVSRGLTIRAELDTVI